MAFRTMCAVLLLGVCGAAAAGQVYKWVDPQGRVHFSDTPKPGWTLVDMKEVSSGGGNSGGGDADLESDAGAASQQQLRAEECQRRRDQLASYQSAARIVERNALGQEKEYSSEERVQLIARTQAQVAELCAPAAG